MSPQWIYGVKLFKKKNSSLQIPNINFTANQMPAIMVGGGGHAQSLFDLATQSGIVVQGYVNPIESEFFTEKQIRYLGIDLEFLASNQKNLPMLLGIGFAKLSQNRYTIRKLYESHGITFKNVYGLNSTISESASISECVYIHQNCHIGSGALIESGAVVNTGAIVEHGVSIGFDSHVAPSAVLCGESSIGDNSQIGANATVLPGVIIGNNVIVGAGTVVISNVDDNSVVVGNPHRSLN